MGAVNAMPEDRMIEYLDTIDAALRPLPLNVGTPDAAADWTPIIDLDGHAPSLDEWNAARLLTGLLVDTFEEYVTALKSGKRWNHEDD